MPPRPSSSRRSAPRNGCRRWPTARSTSTTRRTRPRTSCPNSRRSGDKVKYDVGEGLTFSHLDFDSSPQGKLADIKVRQAFLKCIPRQELVDKFAKPVLPGRADPGPPRVPAGPDELPGDPGSGSGGHPVRPGRHRRRQAAARPRPGSTQPYDLRIIRSATSDLRGQQVAVIKASCDQAGFNIHRPAGPRHLHHDHHPRHLGRGALRLVVSPVRSPPGESIYVTGGEQNFGGYTDPTVDSSWAEVDQDRRSGEGRSTEGADGAGVVDATPTTPRCTRRRTCPPGVVADPGRR